MSTGTDGVEVFRSASARECDERLLVLESLGIPSAVLARPGEFGLWVAPQDAGRAYFELTRYAAENRPAPKPRRVPLQPGAFAGAFAYAIATFVPTALAANAAFGRDWLGAGVLDGVRVRGGEWWRVFTALTLHADLAHFVANAGFGALFGALAARVYGAGRAWLAILLSAAGANALNAAWMSAGRTSLGASTAVFAALGLLAVFRWPDLRVAARAGVRGASVVAALVLLALLGTGDARTDVLAHALGFAAGASAGLAWQSVPGLARVRDRAAATCAVALLAVAWGAALI